MSTRPVILGEDNEKLRHLYCDVLEAAGFNVMAVDNGEKAISLLHKVQNPELIILDIMMPKLNGIDTCARIRKMQGDNTCPIIFLTALDQPETLLECLRAGGDDYLMKSEPVLGILERVKYWSRKGYQEGALERRERAIKELESIIGEYADHNSPESPEEDPDVQAKLELLARVLRKCDDHIRAEDNILIRFGYLVGLMEGVFPSVVAKGRDNKRFLRHLIYRTGFVQRGEVDSLLENYDRLITQSQFRAGWTLGHDHAKSVEGTQ